MLVAAVLMALAGCNEPPLGEPGTLGHVAYSAAGTGKVKIVDVATGAARTVSQGDGPFGTVNLSLDGRSVAYTYHYPEQLKRDVFVADVDSGEVGG